MALYIAIHTLLYCSPTQFCIVCIVSIFLHFCMFVFLNFCRFVSLYFCVFVFLYFCIFAFLHFCVFVFLFFVFLYFVFCIFLYCCRSRTKQSWVEQAAALSPANSCCRHRQRMTKVPDLLAKTWIRRMICEQSALDDEKSKRMTTPHYLLLVDCPTR